MTAQARTNPLKRKIIWHLSNSVNPSRQRASLGQVQAVGLASDLGLPGKRRAWPGQALRGGPGGPWYFHSPARMNAAAPTREGGAGWRGNQEGDARQFRPTAKSALRAVVAQPKTGAAGEQARAMSENA